MPLPPTRFAAVAGSVIMLVLAGCTGPIQTTNEEDVASRETGLEAVVKRESGGSILGEGGLFGNSEGKQSGAPGIGVNSFLWRATLDTVSFMPITTADPFGGVVLTDWRESVVAPDERFRMNIYILGRSLRADGVRVSVLRQVLKDGVWRDAEVPEGTNIKVEDAILHKARQMRRQSLTAQ